MICDIMDIRFPLKTRKEKNNRHRDVGRSENPGVPVLFGGHNLLPLVKIGLTDLPKSGGAMAPPAPPGMTPLHCGTTFFLRK